MKRLSFLSMFALAGLFVSCTKSTSDPGPVTPIVTQGDWVVSLFTEPGENKTGEFSGYSFTFQTDGKLIVRKNGTTQKEGSWSENTSSHKLIIELGPKDNSNKPLGELTDDWMVSSRSDSKISLRDDNSTSNEILEFSKN